MVFFMPVSYPFAAVPNQVIRGGHGAINIAVLAALLSHGKTFARAETIAQEIGCDRKSVYKAVNYWIEHGPAVNVFLKREHRDGKTTLFEIKITKMYELSRTENGTGSRTENGTAAVPKTERKEEHSQEKPLKEDYLKDSAPKGADTIAIKIGNETHEV